MSGNDTRKEELRAKMEEISVRIYRFLQGDETALDFQRPYDDVNGNPVPWGEEFDAAFKADKEAGKSDLDTALHAFAIRAVHQHRPATELFYEYCDTHYAKVARAALSEVGADKSLLGMTVVYHYYALHPEINPASPCDGLSGSAVEEIRTIAAEYIADHQPQPYKPHQSNSYSIGHSKPFNAILGAIQGGDCEGQLQVMMYPGNAKLSNVVTYMSLTYTGDAVQLRGRRALTGYDKAVYNTLSTLWNAGNSHVTPHEILRHMNGRAASKGYSKSQIDRVNNSIRKMMGTILYLDMSDDMQKTGFRINDDRVAGCKIETQLLQATRCELRTETGRTVEGWNIDREPIMYTYNKAKRQIVTVPIGLLDTSAAVSNTEDVIAIREYLLLQIENMRTKHRHNNVIRYDTLYSETGIMKPTGRVAQGRQRDQIKAMLDLWKQRGYISGYADQREGSRIIGVQVHVSAAEGSLPAAEQE